MRLEPISISNAVISALVTLILSSLMTLIAIRLYNREQIVTGKA